MPFSLQAQEASVGIPELVVSLIRELPILLTTRPWPTSLLQDNLWNLRRLQDDLKDAVENGKLRHSHTGDAARRLMDDIERNLPQVHQELETEWLQQTTTWDQLRAWAFSDLSSRIREASMRLREVHLSLENLAMTDSGSGGGSDAVLPADRSASMHQVDDATDDAVSTDDEYETGHAAADHDHLNHVETAAHNTSHAAIMAAMHRVTVLPLPEDTGLGQALSQPGDPGPRVRRPDVVKRRAQRRASG